MGNNLKIQSGKVSRQNIIALLYGYVRVSHFNNLMFIWPFSISLSLSLSLLMSLSYYVEFLYPL